MRGSAPGVGSHCPGEGKVRELSNPGRWVSHVISYEHRYIFVHIPRTAGSSVEDYLQGVESGPIDRFRQFLPGCGDGRQHLYLNELLVHRDFGDSSREDFFRFCVVRNPWDWFLSEVFYWIGRGQLRGNASDYKHAFFSLLESKEIDNHRIESQLDYVSIDGEIAVDFIGKYETIDQDFLAIRLQIGIQDGAPLPRVNASPKTCPFWEYYDDEMKEAVGERYARDIAAFSYTFPK